MLIELLIGAGVASGAAMVARTLKRRRAASRQEPREKAVRSPSGELHVSDVVLYLDQEFWLAGRVRLIEDDESVANLFRTPGAEPVTWLGELNREVILFRDTLDVPGGRVSDELPLDGRSLRLYRRGRARLEAEGEQLPTVSESCEFALMRDGSGRRLLILDQADRKRWSLLGEYVSRDLLDILPGSQAEKSD